MKKKYSSFNILFVTFISFFSLFMFIFLSKYLPNKLLNDSNTIKNGMLFSSGLDKSFLSTMHFYMFFGMNYDTPIIVINLFSWLILVFTLLTFLKLNKSINFTIYQIIFISFFSLMFWLYFSQYSKDIIVIIIFILAINISKNQKYLLINLILAIGIYGYFFRSYWLIVFTIALIIILFIKIAKNKKNIYPLAYIFIAFVLFIFIYYLVIHKQVTDIRFTFFHPGSKSIIHNIVPDSSVLFDVINYIYVLISLLIPIQGLSSINMLIYYFWIWNLIIYILRHKYNIDFKLLLLFIVFINVQALFEPDFGSVLRHQMAWAPIIYYFYRPVINIK